MGTQSPHKRRHDGQIFVVRHTDCDIPSDRGAGAGVHTVRGTPSVTHTARAGPGRGRKSACEGVRDGKSDWGRPIPPRSSKKE